MKNFTLAALLVMAVLSFLPLAGFSLAGTAVALGIIFFFIFKVLEKQAFANSGLDIRAAGASLKNKSTWFWMALPILANTLAFLVGKYLVPEYTAHVFQRSQAFLSYEKLAILVPQLAVLALGEEIAWRAFFQKRIGNLVPFVPALLITSALFAIGHLAEGSLPVVAVDVIFIFINSILYGVIFQKTNNAWVSGLAHFAANLFSVIVLLFI